MGPNAEHNISEFLERLVQLYEAWNKKDKADECRKKLQAAKATEKPPEKK